MKRKTVMRVFVYEYLTAQGKGRGPDSPDHGMYREGRAMRDALVGDLGRVPGVAAFAFPDDAPPVDWQAFVPEVEAADWTVVIAPELDEVLAATVEVGRAWGGRVLGPSDDAVALTSDKLALAGHWREHGVPTPATTGREPTACEVFPVVWKPRDGCGSTATFRLDSALDVPRAKARLAAEDHAGPMVLQEFVPGRAASVSFLCGPAGNVPLVPALQHLSDDGRFKYLGGELPIPPALAGRAVRLAQRAVDRVPGLLGYVGVDLVLGEAADGSRDVAIEINPRLTTSYVGLRALADFNLAEAMLRAADGAPVGPLGWKGAGVRFRPDGAVTRF